ncbi:hypothetical protein C8A03DRAFT_34071 [Achaetomium macrosporum]|uniref:Uncharacterized protein n=1 Tax=Achaetomium macrosporum TaxID=79813 RepID=A0AAN7HDU1_9PEZI|nr:hypothetical protein C8A03DRAFT_34071 [Achaetomium macrosporum]
MNPASASSTAAPECGFQGNSDIYGLGIRVGIYLQWLAAIVAELSGPDDIEVSHRAAGSYQLAMLAGLVLVTQDHTPGVHAVEAFLILLFCFAGVWVASIRTARASGLSAMLSETRVEHPGSTTRPPTPATGFFRQLLGCATCAYGIWTLFVGLDVLPRTACDEVGFFFARVRLFGWFRDMFKVFFIISLVASSVLLVEQVVRRGTLLAVLMRDWPRLQIASSPPLENNIPASGLEAGRTVLLRQSLGGIVALGLFVVAVELTLSWNSVRGVYTCEDFGQLFPLVLSASNLVSVSARVAKAIMMRNVSVKL